MQREGDETAVCAAPQAIALDDNNNSSGSSSSNSTHFICNRAGQPAFEHSLQSFLQRLYAQQYQVHRAFSSLIERVEKTTRAFSSSSSISNNTTSEAHITTNDSITNAAQVASLIASVKATETLYCFLFDRVLVHQLDADMAFFKDVQSYMDHAGQQPAHSNEHDSSNSTTATTTITSAITSAAVACKASENERQGVLGALDAARRAPFAVHRRQARYLAELPVLHGTMPYARLPGFSQRETRHRSNRSNTQPSQTHGIGASNHGAVKHEEVRGVEEDEGEGESGGALTPSSEEASSPCAPPPSEQANTQTDENHNNHHTNTNKDAPLPPPSSPASQEGRTTVVRNGNEDTARLLRTMQRVFAISGHYSAATQYDILHTVTHTLRLAAVLLPSAVADEDHLAGLLNCAFLVTPQSPATAQPRVVYVRKESLDLFVRQRRRRTASTAEATNNDNDNNNTTSTPSVPLTTNDKGMKAASQLSVSDVNCRGLMTTHKAAAHSLDEEGSNHVREGSMGECDDAELADLLEQLDRALTRPVSPPHSNNNRNNDMNEDGEAGTSASGKAGGIHNEEGNSSSPQGVLRAMAQARQRRQRYLVGSELLSDKTTSSAHFAQVPSRKRVRVAERASWTATLSATALHSNSDSNSINNITKFTRSTGEQEQQQQRDTKSPSHTSCTTPPLTFTQLPIESQLIRYEHAEERDEAGQMAAMMMMMMTTSSTNKRKKIAAGVKGGGENKPAGEDKETNEEEEDAWVFQISHSLKDMKAALIAAIQQLGGRVNTSAKYDPHTSYLVLMEGMADRTEKYLSCCAAGKRIVPPRFVFDSAARGHWLQSRIAEYDMNPRHRFARCLPCPAPRPFCAWRVVLFTSNAFIAAGIRTVLGAGGCNVIYSYLADNAGGSNSVAAGGCRAYALSETSSSSSSSSSSFCGCGVHEEGKEHNSNDNNGNTVAAASVAERMNEVALLEQRMQTCTHVLVECTVMSPAPYSSFFALPVWYPRLFVQPALYAKTFTLELLYYCLCTSAAPVFDDATGGLIAEDRLIPACRVAPFTQHSKQ